MVHPNAYGRVVFFAEVEKRHKARFDFLQLSCIFFVGIFLQNKLSCRVNIVAGINSYLLGEARCHIGHVGIEMHIGHQRRVITQRMQPVMNVFEVLGLAYSLCREAH